MDAQDDIWVDFSERKSFPAKPRDLLIIGALEAAFKEMVMYKKVRVILFLFIILCIIKLCIRT